MLLSQISVLQMYLWALQNGAAPPRKWGVPELGKTVGLSQPAGGFLMLLLTPARLTVQAGVQLAQPQSLTRVLPVPQVTHTPTS